MSVGLADVTGGPFRGHEFVINIRGSILDGVGSYWLRFDKYLKVMVLSKVNMKERRPTVPP